MYQDAFEAVCNAAKAKTNLFKKNPLGYFVSAMIAGMFIAFGAFISNAAAAPFADAQDPMQKFMNSMTFSAALSMVLMAGADLFTGNNFILSSAAFAKKMKWSDVVKIWVVCYLGNLVGSLIAAFIFQASGAASGTVGQLFAAAAETTFIFSRNSSVLKFSDEAVTVLISVAASTCDAFINGNATDAIIALAIMYFLFILILISPNVFFEYIKYSLLYFTLFN